LKGPGEINLASELCLECGLCCNGVIFGDVKLQKDDDADRLRSLGLQVIGDRTGGRRPKFPQPCAALQGCHCHIYPERPRHCRQFECLTLKRVLAGQVEAADARRLIRTARGRADKVRRLLRKLGDDREGAALRLRFQRTAKRLETAALDDTAAKTFSQLTLAFQDLNLLLSEAFYPGSGP
jgi:Fe-S-cluster containining protein